MAWAVVSLTAALMAACGGGSNDGTTEPANETPPMVDTANTQGVVWIETRSTKTTVDAWFTERTSPASSNATWQSGSDFCNVTEVSENAASAGRGGTPITLDAGDRMTLSARSGESVELNAQRVAGKVFYATDERWVTGPVADDLVLEIEGGEAFPAASGLAVTLVDVPVVTTPEGNLLSDPGEAIRWNTSSVPNTRIALTLQYGQAETGRMGVIQCELEDDGVFTVSELLVADLPDVHGGLLLTLGRYFTEEHAVGESSLSITALAYP